MSNLKSPMNKLPKVLRAPDRPSNLHHNAKWLAGEGAGSWFLIEACEENEQEYQVQRFSPEGKLECTGIFAADLYVDLNIEYVISYPSQCQKVTIIQGERSFTMVRIGR